MLAVALTGASFGACAQGAQLGVGGSTTITTSSSTSTGSHTTSSSGTGGEGSGIGAPCPNGKCAIGTCTQIGGTAYCTQACPPECPSGTYCSIIEGNSICVPDLGQECDQCTTSSSCKLPSDNCLTAPAGDSFCARDCTIDSACPDGYVCVDSPDYGPDAGTSDAGGSDAGTSGGSVASSSSSSSSGGLGGAGGASSDGGMSDAGVGGSAPTAPARWCVPAGNASCTCNTQRNGVTSNCSQTNSFGTCVGQQACNGSVLSACTAQTPAMEICNGIDDNCNGQIDEGTSSTLCAFMGAPPANSSWACTNGTCVLGSCLPGFTQYPASSTSCACALDADEPNDLCSQASPVGTVTSAGGSITVTGTLSSDTDVDVYSFQTTDAVLASSNGYHVAVQFSAPMPNGEFQMDVLRGPTCLDAPTGDPANITSYDWCVNGTNAVGSPVVTTGETPCGPTDANHCTDQSSPYFVRVHRMAGVTGTCTPYTLTITASAGACADWTLCQ